MRETNKILGVDNYSLHLRLRKMSPANHMLCDVWMGYKGPL